MFWFTKKFEILEIHGDAYHPVIEKTGKYSLDAAAEGLSKQHKQWLDLSTENKQEIC